MKTAAALMAFTLTLSACSGEEGAKCAEDADCGTGLVCFTSTSPTIQKFFRVTSYNRITRQLVPSTCVEPASVRKVARGAAAERQPLDE